jgi:hypothetical protein
MYGSEPDGCARFSSRIHGSLRTALNNPIAERRKTMAVLALTIGEEDPKESSLVRSFGRLTARFSRGQLLTQRQILERNRPVSAAHQSNRSEEHRRRQHARSSRAFDRKINCRNRRSSLGEGQARGPSF